MPRHDPELSMTDEPREALRRLEERLSQASETAERLIAEAARSPRGHQPPPSGWQMPNGAEEDAGVRGLGPELEMVLAAAALLRDLVPPEVLARLAAAVRELLLAVRALIDFYIERLDRPRTAGERVRDIPID
jgi:hypothetical protein